MIIGIHIGICSGVAVYENGDIIYAVSEERFSRRKNDSRYPQKAISNAIKVCQITSDKIEKIIFPSEAYNISHIICELSSYSMEDYVREERKYYYPKFYKGEDVDYLECFHDKAIKSEYQDLLEAFQKAPDDQKYKVYDQWRIRRAVQDFNVPMEKVCIINHEFSHAAYGLYGSNFKDYSNTLCVVYDGWGDYSNASIYVHDGESLKQIKCYKDYNIGRLYRYITLLLGMKPNEHEYKVMGLAPYATEYNYKKPLQVFKKAYDFSDGEVHVDPKLKDNYYYFKERLEGMRFDGIAAALQVHTEYMNCKLIDYWMKETGKKRLVISGGVSMNVKSNMETGKLLSVENLFVPGSGDDSSLCIGSIYAYLDGQKRGGEINQLQNLYLGDQLDEQNYVMALDKVDRKKYEVIENPADIHIAKLLAEGCILGRVSGRMEFGARALGNRSILADPRDKETVGRINKKIKNRDFWMPFTPSILEDDAEKYLVNPKRFKFPYMTVASETTKEGRKKLAAAIHPADLTARPQIVTRESNERYYRLISAFKDITGVGGLLNTSLNLHGYPIVRTAEEAYLVLENSDLDGMILDKYLVLRKRGIGYGEIKKMGEN